MRTAYRSAQREIPAYAGMTHTTGVFRHSHEGGNLSQTPQI